MAGQHGGYRKPAHPASASGPGELSKRTDGGPGHGQALQAYSGGDYGSRQATLDQERSAPMAKEATPSPMPVPQGGGQPAAAPYPGGDFGGPTQRPDEPVTHGVDIGAGGDSSVLGFQTGAQRPDGALTAMLAQLSATDTTGTLADLYLMAKQRGV